MDFIGDGPNHSFAAQYARPQTMFKTLRRLHGHNLENQGLNSLSDAFQSFMTRAKFFSIGRLRRTWSHSAVEFMKYRRLLPMLVSDEYVDGSSFDDFDPFNQSLASVSKPEDRRITVSNISVRATSSQIQSFFTKFGKVQSCHIPSEDRRQTMYATMTRRPKKNVFVAHITFKKEESAQKAKQATADELIFYGQKMTVSPYVPSGRRRTSSIQDSLTGSVTLEGAANQSYVVTVPGDEASLSRSSSVVSISSLASAVNFSCVAFPFDELPMKVLKRIFLFLDPINRIRLERVNKSWLEAAAKAWSICDRLSFNDGGGQAVTIFNKTNPLRTAQLRAFLCRCGPHLRSIDLSNVVNLLDDKAVEVIAQCTNLVELDISGVNASPEALRLLSELKSLRRVAYRGMESANERHFWNLFKGNAKNIVYVDLQNCRQLRGRCFKLFGGELEEVLIDGCRRIDDEVIEDICTRSGCLRVLEIDGCNLLTDDSLSLISRNLLELEQLSLNGDNFSKITTDGLIHLSRLSSLKKLSFDYNSCVSNELLEALTDGIPELRFLSIAYAGTDTTIHEDALMKLANLKNLTELDISGVAAVTNNFLQSLCNSCSKLKRLVTRNCSYLGDDGVLALKHLKSSIEHVDLSGCILVTHRSVQLLVDEFKIEDGQNLSSATVLLIVGGTICEKSQMQLTGKKSRVHVDFNDYSALHINAAELLLFAPSDDVDDSDCVEDDLLDDEFHLLSAHRSFIADAFEGEDDFLDNERSIAEWAEREAAGLGINVSGTENE